MTRLEKKLIDYAYGELSEAESAKMAELIEQRPDLQARLKTLGLTRTRLNLLQDIPEAQLSTERLRDAILGQGLKPESHPEKASKATTVAAWSLSVVAVCAIAGTAFIYSHSNPVSMPGGKAVVNQNLLANNDPDQSNFAEFSSTTAVMDPASKFNFAKLSDGDQPGEAMRTPAQELGLATAKRSVASDRAANLIDLKSLPLNPLNNAQVVGDPLKSKPAGGKGDLGPKKESKPHRSTYQPAHKHHTFVVIGGEDDAATGLPKAQEVADASHVVLSS